MVEKPVDVATLRSRFATTDKVLDGCIHRRKARFVAQGFRQRPGRDYDASALSSPTAGISVIRSVLALGSRLGWGCYSFHVSSAYLCANLPPEEYVSTWSNPRDSPLAGSIRYGVWSKPCTD